MMGLPSIREIATRFANVAPVKEPIPVIPTTHYQMGCIPASMNGLVVGAAKGSMRSMFCWASKDVRNTRV
jgi:succinate dehydrogenase / fumarate reductase flavoprotein subunit